MLRIAVLILAAAPVLAAPIPRDASRANYFPLAKGTTWTYRSEVAGFVIRVSESQVKNGRTQATLVYKFDNAEQSETMAGDTTGVYRPGENGSFDKPVLVLKYPLKVGETWTSRLPLGGANPEAKATVKRAVEVTVPAGKYEAMEVEFMSTGEGRPNTLTAWYAPNVGVVKQTTVLEGRSTTIELAEFTPGK